MSGSSSLEQSMVQPEQSKQIAGFDFHPRGQALTQTPGTNNSTATQSMQQSPFQNQFMMTPQ